MPDLDDITVDQLIDKADHQQNKKGLIVPVDSTQTYQPCNKGQQDRQTNQPGKN